MKRFWWLLAAPFLIDASSITVPAGTTYFQADIYLDVPDKKCHGGHCCFEDPKSNIYYWDSGRERLVQAKKVCYPDRREKR